MVACYIDSSFPALLHFAYKYADSPEKAILANANAGEHLFFAQLMSDGFPRYHFRGSLFLYSISQAVRMLPEDH